MFFDILAETKTSKKKNSNPFRLLDNCEIRSEKLINYRSKFGLLKTVSRIHKMQTPFLCSLFEMPTSAQKVQRRWHRPSCENHFQKNTKKNAPVVLLTLQTAEESIRFICYATGIERIAQVLKGIPGLKLSRTFKGLYPWHLLHSSARSLGAGVIQSAFEC